MDRILLCNVFLLLLKFIILMDMQIWVKSELTFKFVFSIAIYFFHLFLLQTRRAEVKVAVAMVQHNVSFAVADHFSPLYRECFKDSPTAQNFKSASTKTMCIINQAVAPHYRNELVMKMRENPFTLVTDGSNDTGIPLTAKLPVSISSCSCHTH